LRASSFAVRTSQRRECVEITDRVRDAVRKSGVRSGLCHVMALHATAAVVVNENDDPNVGVDLLDALERTAPARAGWLHDRVDDNASSHIQAALLGPSELVQVDGGDLVLGRWQEILLVELDGPRAQRRVSVRILGGD
jgi:secondary thiamine-phosphate synthase enzyme